MQFWTEEQINEGIPLDYWQGEEVEEAECEKPVEQVNACMQNCQTSFDIRYAGDLSDMCYTEAPDVSSRSTQTFFSFFFQHEAATSKPLLKPSVVPNAHFHGEM